MRKNKTKEIFTASLMLVVSCLLAYFAGVTNILALQIWCAFTSGILTFMSIIILAVYFSE